MKNINTASKYVFLIVGLFVFGCVGAFGQTAPKPADEYVNNAFKFSFKPPKDSVVALEQKERSIIYWGRPRMTMGSEAAFMLIIQDNPMADKVSEMLVSNDTAVALFAAKVRDNIATRDEASIVDKEVVKIAGLNALKTTLSVTKDKRDTLWIVYTIPCPEHKRVYTFTISTESKLFNNWAAVAEPAVNSFKILK